VQSAHGRAVRGKLLSHINKKSILVRGGGGRKKKESSKKKRKKVHKVGLRERRRGGLSTLPVRGGKAASISWQTGYKLRKRV